MRLRARWAIAPLLAAPAGAWALGLGQLELQSALNQPFRAEIELSANADELQGLKVGLASADMFARQNLDRPAFLNSLEFRIVTGRTGRSVVQITSRESIAEPFVTMLVEATWPRGRLVRDYTVLLDPPVLLPAPTTPPAIQPAETRTSETTSGGPINRPASPPAPRPTPPAAPAPAQDVTPAVREPAPDVSSTAPAPAASPTSSAPPPRQPVSAAGGTYGPVQRGDTLWALSNRTRPEGISINQMMIAIYRENPSAFGGNINLLRAGATLRLPESVDFDGLAATVANAEVRRQTDEWQERTAQGGQLRLLPPSESARTPTPAPVERVPTPAPGPRPADTPAPVAGTEQVVAANNPPADDRRVLEVHNDALQNLQESAADLAAADGGATPDAAASDPGVDVESEQVFTDEQPAPQPEEAAAPAPTPVATPAAPPSPSLVSQVLDWVSSPLLWIGLGVVVVLFSALWFVRRRRQEAEDVTGRWEALESETDDDDQHSREATERMRRHVAEETIVVEEQHADQLRPAPPPPEQAPPKRTAAPRAQKSLSPDETLSSQTVINLDQADAVAEADFHIAYGLYDQAAELVQKALEAAPDRRDLKLKLLEVYFMWGNKDAFLKAAQGLRADLGGSDDADWNKVVIMGKQICPDEKLFSEAKAGASRVDVDLEAGDSPLDLAFDGTATADLGPPGGLDLDLEASDQRPAPKAAKPAAKSGKPAATGDLDADALDIGARTAAGLEAALFTDDEEADTGRRTSPDLTADSLAVTQESPTIERPGNDRWTLDVSHDSPTVETPTIEQPAAKSPSSTQKSKTVSMPHRNEAPTVETPALGAATGEFTAEIDLDDLGLDVKDIEGLSADLGDLPTAGGASDTREQPALRDDDGLLSATGVTKVLHGAGKEAEDDDSTESNTSVLDDQDATLLAGTLTGTEVLEGRRQGDNSGATSLMKSLKGGKDAPVDLDLADLTAALHGADTVEQPRQFSRDVFGSGSTPLDLDVGNDAAVDDDPTGTEESALDPQTMTEVGTKLDLARAYIDMGDPEGARSILQEVLDEGDSNQRREAQGLIDALPA
ncbi:MAG TPA: FimV/HubP family polar landmark protein [Gammaproteobacteria bacterium]